MKSRYLVRFWYPSAGEWQDYFCTDDLACAEQALRCANPPHMGLGDYAYIMRHVRANNRRQIFDTDAGKVIRDKPRPGKLRRWLDRWRESGEPPSLTAHRGAPLL